VLVAEAVGAQPVSTIASTPAAAAEPAPTVSETVAPPHATAGVPLLRRSSAPAVAAPLVPSRGVLGLAPWVIQNAPAPAANSATSSQATDEALAGAVPVLPSQVAMHSEGDDPLLGALFDLDPLTLDLLARAHVKVR
jgi:hypothetical protein